MFRANDRHPDDETFLFIKDPDEFALFHERKKLGLRGIVYDAFADPRFDKDTLTFETISFGNHLLSTAKDICTQYSLESLMDSIQMEFSIHAQPGLKPGTPDKYKGHSVDIDAEIAVILNNDPEILSDDFIKKLEKDTSIKFSSNRSWNLYILRFKSPSSGNTNRSTLDMKTPGSLRDFFFFATSCFRHSICATKTCGSFRVNSSFPESFHSHDALTVSLSQTGTEILSPENRSFFLRSGQIGLLGNEVNHRAYQAPLGTLQEEPRTTIVL